ncbi:hypothetical protein CRG98_035877 [Punica granatum]|uniref:Uncharacterized protein n=1 Tax=Punica granatum TaxID=22663 RepID=A0A2I0IJ45_PUNGR|nr:hypothetical protein CRG98_035877 [Punica granatum]
MTTWIGPWCCLISMFVRRLDGSGSFQIVRSRQVVDGADHWSHAHANRGCKGFWKSSDEQEGNLPEATVRRLLGYSNISVKVELDIDIPEVLSVKIVNDYIVEIQFRTSVSIASSAHKDSTNTLRW